MIDFTLTKTIYLGCQTVSAAFCLRFGDDFQGSYSDKKRAELREALSELKLIFIDEILLISADMLYKLGKKLKEIFVEKNKTPFGGIGLMLVGNYPNFLWLEEFIPFKNQKIKHIVQLMITMTFGRIFY